MTPIDILRKIEKPLSLTTILMVLSLFAPSAKNDSQSFSLAALQVLNTRDSIVYAQGTIPLPPTPGPPITCIADFLAGDSNGVIGGAAPIRVTSHNGLPDQSSTDAGGLQSFPLKAGETKVEFGEGILDFSIKLSNEITPGLAQVAVYEDGCDVSGEIVNAELPLGATISFETTLDDSSEVMAAQLSEPSTIVTVEDNGIDGVIIQKSTTQEGITVDLPAGQVFFGDGGIMASSIESSNSLIIQPSKDGDVTVAFRGEKTVDLGTQSAGTTIAIGYEPLEDKVTYTQDKNGDGTLESYIGTDSNNDGIISSTEIKEEAQGIAPTATPKPDEDTTPTPTETATSTAMPKPTATEMPPPLPKNQIFLPLVVN